MTNGHDFDRFPELTNAQMNFYYFSSPHKQIFEDFQAKVVKVHDGDTITVRWQHREFDFPVRFSNIAAPEMSEKGGKKSQSALEKMILNKKVTIKINKFNRVEKWGRLLGNIILAGNDIGEEMANSGYAKFWNKRLEGVIPDIDWILPKIE